MFRSIAAAHLERASPRVRQGLQRALPAHWSVRCPCAAPPDDAPPLETRPSSLRCDAPPLETRPSGDDGLLEPSRLIPALHLV
jgi:hypothetical protein